MGIREAVNKYQKAAFAVSSSVIVTALVFSVTYQGEDSLSANPPERAYYSDDDGKTFFPAEYGKIGPFDHDGKEAVVARVFRDRDRNLFVGYLERAADAEAKAFLEDAQRTLVAPARDDPRPDPRLIDEMMKRLVVKRPGQKKWVNAQSADAAAVTRIELPSGGEATLAEP
jgi:hypothetical protein